MKIKFIALFAALTLAACAEPSRVAQMTISELHLQKPVPSTLKNNIYIGEVSGGKSTNPALYSNVDDHALSEAMKYSLEFAGLYAPYPQGAYKLDITLNELKQPMGGLSLKVKSDISYRISGTSRTEEFNIEATSVVPMGDAILFSDRLRIANERSIKENFGKFISQLMEKFRR